MPSQTVCSIGGSLWSSLPCDGYLAYGEANPSLTKTAAGFTPSTNLYRFSGKRFDPAARAYDMGARHYFPAQARWFQQDLYSGALSNLGLSIAPLTVNRYQFTGANPVNYVEVDGHYSANVNLVDGGGEAGWDVPEAPIAVDPGPERVLARLDPRGASPASCLFSGRLDCDVRVFAAASWTQRLAWLELLNGSYGLGRWLDSISGIIRYFSDSQYFANDAWAKVSDGGVLWAIQDGLRLSRAGFTDSQPWARFFGALEAGADDVSLRNLWGRAESAGVRFGVALADAMVGRPGGDRGELAYWFIVVGDLYRGAVTNSRPFGLNFRGLERTRGPADPRRDAGTVYRSAIALEKLYRTLPS